MISSPGSTVVGGCRITMYNHHITGAPREKTPSGTNRSAQCTKQECTRHKIVVLKARNRSASTNRSIAGHNPDRYKTGVATGLLQPAN
ncbi:unnamed protein product [Linum trigynum]|uniref:Uncharacterized protein n=1 Tax=Linum trigynum TaxID=586398 RepID=A0AAV2G5B4_9ROSI